MKIVTKFVRFDEYCPLCQNWNKLATDEPCNECLTTPARDDSSKPINFKKK